MHFKYITSDPEILGGKPIIKGSRISVQLILEWIADGASVREISEEFPHLPVAGIREAVFSGCQTDLRTGNSSTANFSSFQTRNLQFPPT